MRTLLTCCVFLASCPASGSAPGVDDAVGERPPATGKFEIRDDRHHGPGIGMTGGPAEEADGIN